MKSSNLTNRVMRRVYYAYAMSIATHPMFWQGMFLSVAVILLARWLHVASIADNLLATPVGTVPDYVYNSFTTALKNGEVTMVLTFVLATLVAISVGYKLAQFVAHRGSTFKKI